MNLIEDNKTRVVSPRLTADHIAISGNVPIQRLRILEAIEQTVRNGGFVDLTRRGQDDELRGQIFKNLGQ